jgi:DNA-binding PadR family transcriptional regulator
MATSKNLSLLAWGWRDLYVAALMEADNDRMSVRITDAERVMLERARELFQASGDNIQEEEALDDALYALRALKTCLEIHGGFATAA